jgi:Leucine-rich repeat (LRR) protein
VSPKVYKLCSAFEKTTLKPETSPFCTGWEDENLILNKMCSAASVLCDEIVTVESEFFKFSPNSFSKSFYSIVIRQKNYKEVPSHSFESFQVEQLDLQANRIEVIDKQAFENVSGLRVLRLSNNELTEIVVGYLIDLEVLDVGRNMLTKIESSMFMNLTKLKYLDLYYNQIESIEKDSFSQNSELRYLDLSSNQLKSLSFNLDLKKLSLLNLNENKIADLKDGVFANLTWLRILTIEKNDLARNLDLSLQLGFLKHLKLLKLDNNHLEFVDLHSLLFILGNLVRLTLTRNNLQSIKSVSSNGSCKQNNFLNELDLSFNKIREIEPFSFACFQLLDELDLSSHMLTNLSTPDLFYRLKTLDVLKLNNNSLRQIYKNTFIHLSTLYELDLTFNELQWIDENAFQGLQNLLLLHLSGNRLKMLASNMLRSRWELERLSINHNKLTGIDPNSFTGLEKHLKNIEMHSNRLQFLKNYFFTNLSNLQFIDLSDNQISSIQRDTFKDLTKLDTLNLSDNSIARIDSHIFKNTPNLVYLILSFNVLVELKQGCFKHLKTLTVLDLGFNNLVKINVKQLFSNDSDISLEDLNLENNLINELDMDWFRGVDRLADLNLNNNKFNTKIVQKTKNNFNVLPDLEYLYLRNASTGLVRQFDLRKLLEIDFSYTTLDDDILQKLPFDTIQSLKLAKVNGLTQFKKWKKFGPDLNYIDLSFNSINLTDFFVKLSNCYSLSTIVLEQTGLNDNLLSKIDLSLFFNLNHLDLSSNEISYFSYRFLDSNNNLTFVNLSHNFVRKIYKLMFGKKYRLTALDLSHNLIEVIEDGSFLALKDLFHLDLSHNRLKSLDQIMFSTNYLFRLSIIVLNDNRFLNKCDVYFENLNIQSINLAGNNLKNVPNVIVKNVELIEMLDLSRNIFKEIKTSYFQKTNSMIYLFISRNQLELIEDDAFVNLKTLLILDMSFNNLSNLSASTFSGLYNLQVLNLSNNKIDKLQNRVLDSLHHIYELDLTRNSIKLVEEGCFSQNSFLCCIYLSDNLFEKFFKNNTFKGLDSFEYLELPQQAEFSFETSLIVKSSIKVRFLKQVLNYTYFFAVNIVTYGDEVISELHSYTNDECFYIMYLSRNKINLNVFDIKFVDKFVNDCTSWFSQAYALMDDY